MTAKMPRELRWKSALMSKKYITMEVFNPKLSVSQSVSEQSKSQQSAVAVWALTWRGPDGSGLLSLSPPFYNTGWDQENDG